jgi:hypothetical protein
VVGWFLAGMPGNSTGSEQMKSFLKPSRVTAELALLFFLAAAQLAGAETGVIPYKTISAVFDGFDLVKEKDRLVLSVKVVPAKKARPTTPIQLQINSRQGPRPLNLAPDGELVDFPLTPELRAENPPVASNQPKGTLALQATINIRFSGKLTEEAEWYQEALRQVNAAVKAQAHSLSFLVPKSKTLIIAFPPGAPESVTVKTGGSVTRSAQDQNGMVRLALGDEAEFKGATLEFSSKPLMISAE